MRRVVRGIGAGLMGNSAGFAKLGTRKKERSGARVVAPDITVHPNVNSSS